MASSGGRGCRPRRRCAFALVVCACYRATESIGDVAYVDDAEIEPRTPGHAIEQARHEFRWSAVGKLAGRLAEQARRTGHHTEKAAEAAEIAEKDVFALFANSAVSSCVQRARSSGRRRSSRRRCWSRSFHRTVSPAVVAFEIGLHDGQPLSRFAAGVLQHVANRRLALRRTDRRPHVVSRVEEVEDDVAAHEWPTTRWSLQMYT
jgi:hypothetical protein